MEPTLFDAPAAPASDAAAPASDAAAPPEPSASVSRPGTAVRRPTGPNLVAVDGNSLAHRAFHAYGGDQALYGFGALLAAVCDVAHADRLLVGFDCRMRSRRREQHPGYKAGRPPKDPRLNDLLDYVPAFLADLGVEVVCCEGWEADDAVASAAAAAEAAGWRCTVATSDRDAFALVSARTTVLRLRSGVTNAVAMTPARVRRELRIAPDQYTEYAALRGDVSDNLPGVEGIGPSRAAALLREYATVAAALADPLGCRSVLGAALGQRLLDDVASPHSVFRRNVELMTLERGLPVDLAATVPSMSPEEVAAGTRSWGVPALAGRLAVAVGTRPQPVPPPLAPADGRVAAAPPPSVP